MHNSDEFKGKAVLFTEGGDVFSASALRDLLSADYPEIGILLNPACRSEKEEYTVAVCYGRAAGPADEKIPVIRIKTERSDPETGTTVLFAPCRAGVIYDEIVRYFRINRSVKETRIVFGPFVLDGKNGTLYTEKNEGIRLTEKEQAVIEYLHGRRSVAVGKDELLKEVWRYADGVDTHTIETHIYRLRQKIENFSGCADFLITDEKGYRLGY